MACGDELTERQYRPNGDVDDSSLDSTNNDGTTSGDDGSSGGSSGDDGGGSGDDTTSLLQDEFYADNLHDAVVNGCGAAGCHTEGSVRGFQVASSGSDEENLENTIAGLKQFGVNQPGGVFNLANRMSFEGSGHFGSFDAALQPVVQEYLDLFGQ